MQQLSRIELGSSYSIYWHVEQIRYTISIIANHLNKCSYPISFIRLDGKEQKDGRFYRMKRLRCILRTLAISKTFALICLTYNKVWISIKNDVIHPLARCLERKSAVSIINLVLQNFVQVVVEKKAWDSLSDVGVYGVFTFQSCRFARNHLGFFFLTTKPTETFHGQTLLFWFVTNHLFELPAFIRSIKNGD